MTILRLPANLARRIVANTPAGWAATIVSPNPYGNAGWESVRVQSPDRIPGTGHTNEALTLKALRAAMGE